jgi:hypothetical protein
MTTHRDVPAYDIALRDFELLVAAFVLTRLAAAFPRPGRWARKS